VALNDDIWIFGYGSLVWRPAFPHEERRAAWIDGFVRRFWQGSTDHRGVPGAPGRVVTLVPESGARCWGMAYRVHSDQVAMVLETLDIREQGGYERLELPVHFDPPAGPAATPHVCGLSWVATPANHNYLGPATTGAIAGQVRRSHGPSGPNPEYVLRLAEALRELGADDPHVYELEALLRNQA
jgi:cation transport regulator ChaC